MLVFGYRELIFIVKFKNGTAPDDEALNRCALLESRLSQLLWVPPPPQ
jgi:hypothetical protein